MAVDELEESLGEVSLGGGDFFVDGESGVSWSAETRLRRAFSLARLEVGRQRKAGAGE